MKNLIALLIIACTLLLAPPTFGAVTDTLPMGINLAGAEFGVTTYPGKLGTDYTYPTVNEIDYYASKNIKILRLPFKWERIQPQFNGPLDSAQLSYITSFTDTCATRGISVILDLHNYGTYYLNGVYYPVSGTIVTRAMFADVWVKLATVFKSKKNIYAYDIMNEANDLGDQVWLFTAQGAINAIRTVDSTTTIMIAGARNSSAECWPNCSDELKYLLDPGKNLVYDAHCFFDEDGLGYYNVSSYDAVGADPYIGIRRARPFLEWLQLNDKKGFIGAFGAPGDDPRWVAVLDTFLQYITTNCVNGAYWAGGAWWPSDYPLSIEPESGNDKPQMNVLSKYMYVKPDCVPVNTTVSTVDNILTIYIYPSPFTSQITIDQGNCNSYTNYGIFDMSGRLVNKGVLQLNKNDINLSYLQPGVYVVKLLDAKNNAYVKKIIKMK